MGTKIGKIIKEQKVGNQQLSLKPREFIQDIEIDDLIKREAEEKELIDIAHALNSKHSLDDEYRDSVIKDLIEYLGYCKLKNLPFIGKLANYSFKIDENNPNTINITGENGESTLFINGDRIYSEYVEIIKRRTHYRQVIKKYNTPFELIKSTYVIDNEEINEYLQIKKVKDVSDEKLEEITKTYAEEHGYEVVELGLLAKHNVENITKMDDISKDEHVLKEYVIPGTRTLSENCPSGFYENYEDIHSYNYSKQEESLDRKSIIKKSLEFKERALKVYSIVAEVYKKINSSLENEESEKKIR